MKIFVWGTGRLAGKVVGRYVDINKVEAFVDNNRNRKEYMGKKVLSPEELSETDYDAVLVANLYCREIRIQCRELKIDLDKFIFLYNNCFLEDVNRDYGFVEQVLGREYAQIIRKRYHVIRGVEASGELCLEDSGLREEGYEQDYVRIKCFELAVKEIRKSGVKGEVAEVGVFRGEFAQFLNYSFPDRKCYLFDTFDGFDAAEALNEIRRGNCTDAFVEAYRHTNIGEVMRKMRYPDNVVIRQGFFPDSLDGLEEKFAFVSVDVDFEESIYAALQYFYPRLTGGGYLFVHDYSSSLLGVERAVDRYEAEQDVHLCKVPLCDANGTLAITK